MTTQLPIKKEFPYNPIGAFNYQNPNPYTIMFVYTKTGGFIIKGGLLDCEKYFHQNVKDACVVHQTMFHKKATRTNYSIKNVKHKIYFTRYEKDCYHTIILIKNNVPHVIKQFRRVPRKWIKELNQFV